MIVSLLIPVIRAIAATGTGVLLIEQFATVALSLATRAHVMEGGVLRYSGTAAELRDNPDLLHSAYLLRGATSTGAAPVGWGGRGGEAGVAVTLCVVCPIRAIRVAVGRYRSIMLNGPN